jgi:hypothetical protein
VSTHHDVLMDPSARTASPRLETAPPAIPVTKKILLILMVFICILPGFLSAQATTTPLVSVLAAKGIRAGLPRRPV